MQYRPEIDGLRAIAVMAVILFHAKFINGGFIGVDIFFVISGYLITGIILKGLTEHNFSFAKFYERRVRRILPALLLVTLASIPFALYYLSPIHRMEYGKSIIAIVFFVSNIFFYNSINYFNQENEYNPLLNTWSLSVEEQYYLLYPLIIFFIIKHARRYLDYLLILLFVISLIYSQYCGELESKANFYLLPSRVWELMLGGILAYYERKKVITFRFTPIILPIIALLCICASCWYFDKFTISPGYITLVPLFGVAIIIWYCGGNDPITKILSLRPVVFLGKISYSLYLWHWPIFVFFSIAYPRSNSVIDKIILIAVSLLLAILSWRYLESPCRNVKSVKLKPLIIIVITINLCLVIIGCVIVKYRGFPKTNVPAQILSSLKRKQPSDSCVYFKNTDEMYWYCKIGTNTGEPPLFALLGDSHAQDSITPLMYATEITNSYGVASTGSGCTALLGFDIRGFAKKQCSGINEKMYQLVKDQHIKNVILISAWNHEYIANGVNLRRVAEGLQYTVEQYSKIGVDMYVVLQTPKQLILPYYLYNSVFRSPKEYENYMLQKLSTSKPEYLQQSKQFKEICHTIKDPHFHIIDFSDLFCNDTTCPVGTLSESYYSDYNHLSEVGGLRMKDKYISLVQSMQSKRDVSNK